MSNDIKKITNHIIKQWFDSFDPSIDYSRWECGCITSRKWKYERDIDGFYTSGVEEYLKEPKPDCKAGNH